MLLLSCHFCSGLSFLWCDVVVSVVQVLLVQIYWSRNLHNMGHWLVGLAVVVVSVLVHLLMDIVVIAFLLLVVDHGYRTVSVQ